MDDFVFEFSPTRLGWLYLLTICLAACVAVGFSYQPRLVKCCLLLFVALLLCREIGDLLKHSRRATSLRYRQSGWQIFVDDHWVRVTIIDWVNTPLVIVLKFETATGRQQSVIWRDALCSENWKRLIVYLSVV